MGHVDTRSLRHVIESIRATVSQLEQTLPNVQLEEREALIRTLVAYDERIEALELSARG